MKIQNIQRKLHHFECVKGCGAFHREARMWGVGLQHNKGRYTIVTLPRIVTPYRDTVNGTRDRVTYQKLVTR
jgi:hypothetical protein